MSLDSDFVIQELKRLCQGDYPKEASSNDPIYKEVLFQNVDKFPFFEIFRLSEILKTPFPVMNLLTNFISKPNTEFNNLFDSMKTFLNESDKTTQVFQPFLLFLILSLTNEVKRLAECASFLSNEQKENKQEIRNVILSFSETIKEITSSQDKLGQLPINRIFSNCQLDTIRFFCDTLQCDHSSYCV